ncbi:MAG TPA: ABC transporter permease [Thermoanaerobaculia bacterium]|nr:ABC transporter permease [Thermoanaerobaculia bacterium]
MSERYSPLLQLTLARFREFVREPEALFWVFAFPLLLAIALGLAFRNKAPDRIPIGIVEGGAGAGHAAASALSRSPVLLVETMSPREGREALRTGRISLLVEPGQPAAAGPGPAGAAAVREPGAPAVPGAPGEAAVRRPWTFRFDQTRPESRIARLEAEDALQRAAGRADAVAVRSELVTEKGSRYIDFLIPGLLGLNLMGTGIWSLAFGITTARQKQLLKRLVATPMRRSQYLLAQVLGRLVFLLPEIAILVGVGWLVFGVAVRGSLWLLLLASLIGAMTFCGMGLLIASRARTIEGASGLANLVMLPMWLLSGVFFSSDRFPGLVQPLIRALPLTALNESLRGIITEGRPLPAVAAQLAILALWGVGSFLLALKIFRWR